MITHIWTSWNGTKTPLPLMSNDYLINAYIRCLEVVCAENYKARKEIFNGAGYVLKEMDSMYMDLEKAAKWMDRFKDEAAKRKVKLPNIDRTNIDIQYKEKQDRKRYKKEVNQKFDDKFI